MKYKYIVEFEVNVVNGQGFSTNDEELLRQDLQDVVWNGYDDIFNLTVKLQDETCVGFRSGIPMYNMPFSKIFCNSNLEADKNESD